MERRSNTKEKQNARRRVIEPMYSKRFPIRDMVQTEASTCEEPCATCSWWDENDGHFDVARACGVDRRCLGDLRVFGRRALKCNERRDLAVRGKGSIVWQPGWMKTAGLEAKHVRQR